VRGPWTAPARETGGLRSGNRVSLAIQILSQTDTREIEQRQDRPSGAEVNRASIKKMRDERSRRLALPHEAEFCSMSNPRPGTKISSAGIWIGAVRRAIGLSHSTAENAKPTYSQDNHRGPCQVYASPTHCQAGPKFKAQSSKLKFTEARSVVECASPLALSAGRGVRTRLRTAALQDASRGQTPKKRGALCWN
jgi:hypothetical protein